MQDQRDKLFWLSVSKVKTFKDCAAKYKFSYIDRLPKKDRDYLIFGKFLHEILEVFHIQKRDGMFGLDQDFMDQAYQMAYENWKEKLTPEQETEAKEIISYYLKNIAAIETRGEAPEVISLEKEIKLVIADQILLTGYIDLFQKDHDLVPHVIDYKTSKDGKYLKKDFLQLRTYAFAICLEDESVEKVRGSYLLLKQKCEMITEEFQRKDLMRVEGEFLDYYKDILDEKLFRPKTTILCKYCDFLDHCTAGRQFVASLDKTPKFGATDW